MDDSRKESNPKDLWTAAADNLDNTYRAIFRGNSWSGNERNYVFFGGLPGGNFADLSGVSGLDDPADGKGFGVFDFDRDGWPDIGLVNTNTPRFRLLRNTLGEGPGALDHHYVALRFVGGNREARPSSEWSARDGFGAKVTIDLTDDLTIYREHQTDSGLKSQHSATMLVGIGKHDEARSITIRWLSGKEQTTGSVRAGTLVTVYENSAASPTGEAFVMEPYSKPALATDAQSWRQAFLPGLIAKSELVIADGGKGAEPTRGKLTLYTTMATWCVACVDEMPEFRNLRAAFSQEELAMYGLPVDLEETDAMLEKWFEDQTPPYELLVGLPEPEVKKVNEVVLAELRTDAVPAALVTDASGRVVLARWGVPTVSDLRKLLWIGQEESRGARTGSE